MKKRVLSALLALSTLLTTAPAAYAAEPATQSDGAEIDWPEPTCTVDYKPQSDTVSCEFVEETGDAPAKLVYTIQEGAEGDQVLELSKLADALADTVQYPGDAAQFDIEIHNESGNSYRYKPGSFTLASADTSGMEQSELLPVLGYDGQWIPFRFTSSMVSNQMLKDLFNTSSVNISLEQIVTLYDTLAEEGYDSLTNYFVAWYNKKNSTDYTSFDAIMAVAPAFFEDIQKGNAMKFSCIAEQFTELEKTHPEVMRWAYFPSGKGPESGLQTAGYDGWYQSMFAFAFGDDMANLSTSPSGHTSCHERGVGDYMEGTDLWEQTDAYFCGDGQALAPESGSVLSYSGKWALDGPCIRNAYANYEFSFYGSITLEEVGPITITPVDMTLYIGGSSDYWEDVDGTHLPDADSGIPAPHFYVESSEIPAEHLAGITFHGTGADGTEKSWKLAPYGGEGGQQAIGEDGRKVWDIVSADPATAADASCLYFADEACTIPASTDNIAGNHFTHLYAAISTSDASGAGNTGLYAEVNGQKYALRYGVGTLTVRSVTNDATGGEPYTFDAVHSAHSTVEAAAGDTAAAETATDGGSNAGVVAPAGTKYTVNGHENWAMVGDEQPSILFDDVLSSYELDGGAESEVGQTMLEKAVIDNADALGLDNPNGRQYESKYFDLVDAGDGNVWVKADRQLVIYWPYPDGTTYETAGSYDFDVFHFTGLHREYTTSGEVQAMVNQAAANINNEKGGAASNKTLSLQVEEVVLTEHGIQLIVDQDRYGFSPFVLSWAKKDTGGGDHGGTTYYTLRYESNGGTKYDSERYRRNTLVELDKQPVREGYTFTGWYADKALTEPIDDIRMTSNKTVYAGWERTGVPERLNGDDHFAYIIGRDDGLIHPEATITRAEVATIFFRLLTDEARVEYLTETSPFADVAPDAWYATAVATMEAMGIVEGRAPAVFDPDAPITRGEFAAIAARFDSAPYDGADRFTDIGGHWAAEYINQAAVKGWVEGQPDGSFAPDRSISRAEAMTLVNRVLGRLPETADDLLDGMITWPDNPPDAWYYLAVQEATNSHDYGRKADTVHETWTGLQPVEDWTRYEQ
ncbi:S-layer protein [Flavonifractor plautii]|uniref:S-layer homology domain-containing protein n=1 Tax=Flavonifractor plautii TaxID=292800 RepID=UPI0006BEDE81|nr:S-layer homology domain-containing protein [Flavonifractor plautii]CUP88129.1 S-layer protein [Flavonifractor plautii]CUQ49160.1 cellulosome anchoring protein cohesin subunit [Flavonifractor plautii]